MNFSFEIGHLALLSRFISSGQVCLKLPKLCPECVISDSGTMTVVTGISMGESIIPETA